MKPKETRSTFVDLTFSCKFGEDKDQVVVEIWILIQLFEFLYTELRCIPTMYKLSHLKNS